MPRLAPDEVSKHPTKGYRVSVGTYLKDGKPTEKVFWLGQNLAPAHFAAHTYRKAWAQMQATGVPHWTLELIARCKSTIEFGRQMMQCLFHRNEQDRQVLEQRGQELEEFRGLAFPDTPPAPRRAAPTPMVTAPAEPVSSEKVPMLYAALDSYVAAMRVKALSPSYKRRIEEAVDDLKHYTADMELTAEIQGDPKAVRRYINNPKAADAYRKDVPLAAVDKVWLERVADYLKARPLSRKKDRRAGQRERIKPATVKTLLQHWRQAFDWIDAACESPRFGGWEAPKNMAKLFACDLNQIRTKSERDKAADGPEHLTIEEIKKLLKVASDRQRVLILMGLFTGQGQTELRWTRREEFDLDEARFVHRRNKTGQRGEYWLPPELVTLLQDYFRDVEPIEDGIAFSTRERQPLVTEASDSVRQMFEDVRAAAGITREGVSFYACRRFLGDRAKRKGGVELRDAALAHAGRSVGDKHYSNFRDFGKVEQLAREMYDEMKMAGAFDWPKEDEQTAEAA